ncbi:dUTP diphosphatase [Terribacillus saccharophilus]|uniref:dUTP diphosphatase n=1 Tax=Terribacillus saccharophilus TaxID=361277 RepID=UPI003D369935
MVAGKSYDNQLLEEYVDTLHFILGWGITLDYTLEHSPPLIYKANTDIQTV